MSSSLFHEKSVPIALALVENEGRWLVNRRLSDDRLRGLFEFPGGKIRRGETAEAAAIRECLEEVSLTVEPIDALPPVRYDSVEETILLYPIRCKVIHGIAKSCEPAIGEIRWVDADELRGLAMPPANLAIVEELISRINRLDPPK